MDSKENSEVLLEKMYVGNFRFDILQSDNSIQSKTHEITTKVMHRFSKIDADRAQVELRAVLGGNKGDPYRLDVIVGGVFNTKNFEDDPRKLDFMKNGTLAILFPYLRSTLASLTSIAGVNISFLPVVNTRKFFGDQIKKDDKTDLAFASGKEKKE